MRDVLRRVASWVFQRPRIAHVGFVAAATAAVVTLLTAGVSIDLRPSTSDDADRGSPLVAGSEPNLEIRLDITETLDVLEPGRTLGDDAVARLRDRGFLVFDYVVCSDDVARDRLVVVRETFTGEVVLDSLGTHRSDERTEVLDVLISSGQRCS